MMSFFSIMMSFFFIMMSFFSIMMRFFFMMSVFSLLWWAFSLLWWAVIRKSWEIKRIKMKLKEKWQNQKCWKFLGMFACSMCGKCLIKRKNNTKYCQHSFKTWTGISRSFYSSAYDDTASHFSHQLCSSRLCIS